MDTSEKNEENKKFIEKNQFGEKRNNHMKRYTKYLCHNENFVIGK